MEENNTQQNKPSNAKGLIIIIILAIAGYFIIRSFNKEGGGGNASSISEEDLLPLSALNLQGKWERQDGDLKYILNFKSGNELEFTQYDKDGNITAESDFGSYEVSDGVLYLTITSAGETFADSCNAAVSLEMLIIKTIEGSKLFDGTYVVEAETKAEIDRLKELFSETDSSQDSTMSSTTESTSQTTEAKDSQGTSQQTTSVQDNQNVQAPEVQGEIHLSSYITEYANITRDGIWGGVYPEYDSSIRGYSYEATADNYTLTLRFGYENKENDSDERIPSEKIMFIDCPVQILLSAYMSGNTYYDLKSLLGDTLAYNVENIQDNIVKTLSAEIDGCTVSFNFTDNELTADTVITGCTVDVRNWKNNSAANNAEPEDNDSFKRSRVINNVINSDLFKIGATFGNDWTFANDGIIAQYNGITEINDETIKSAFETNGIFYDAVIENTATNANISFIAEDLEITEQNEAMSEYEYTYAAIDGLEGQLVSQGYTVNYFKYGTTEFAGAEHACTDISISVDDTTFYEHQIFVKAGKYMGILTIMTLSEEEAENIAQIFYGI